jgi:hypothetical protein
MRSTPKAETILSLSARIEKFAREKVFTPNGFDSSQLKLKTNCRYVRDYEIRNIHTLNSYQSKYTRNSDYLSSPWHILFRFFGFDTSIREEEAYPSLLLNVLLNFIRWQGFNQSSYFSMLTSVCSNFIAMLFFVPLHITLVCLTTILSSTKVFTELLPGIIFFILEIGRQRIFEYRQSVSTRRKMFTQGVHTKEKIAADLSYLLTGFLWLVSWLPHLAYFLGRTTTSPMNSAFHSFYDTKTYLEYEKFNKRIALILAYFAAIWSLLFSTLIYGMLFAAAAPILLPSNLMPVLSLFNGFFSAVDIPMTFIISSTFFWETTNTISLLALPILALGTGINWFLHHSSNYFPEEENGYKLSDYIPCFKFASLSHKPPVNKPPTSGLFSFFSPATPKSNQVAQTPANSTYTPT